MIIFMYNVSVPDATVRYQENAALEEELYKFTHYLDIETLFRYINTVLHVYKYDRYTVSGGVSGETESGKDSAQCIMLARRSLLIQYTTVHCFSLGQRPTYCQQM